MMACHVEAEVGVELEGFLLFCYINPTPAGGLVAEAPDRAPRLLQANNHLSLPASQRQSCNEVASMRRIPQTINSDEWI